MMISFWKCRSNALAPSRAHCSDAGMDVFYCPDLEKDDGGVKSSPPLKVEKNTPIEDKGSVIVPPNSNVLFPTGLKFGIPHGYMLQVCNRGSMGAKKSLVVGAHIIDSGYSGEVFVDLHNIGSEQQTIMPGDKIAQLIMVPVMSVIPIEAAFEESLYGMYPITISDRGEGKLGSSDLKTQKVPAGLEYEQKEAPSSVVDKFCNTFEEHGE